MGTSRNLAIFDDDNEKWKQRGKRVPWAERMELIRQEFPGIDDLNWNAVLRDDDIFVRLVKDILKVDQMEPGRAGPRPNVDPERGRQAWREWTGQDYSHAPFVEAFSHLARGYSYTQIARKTNISRSRVYRLAKGKEKPSTEDLRAIAEAFGKKPGYFAEYRAAYIVSLFAARVERETELSVNLYLKLVRA